MSEVELALARLERLGGPALVNRMIELFLENCASRLQTIRSGCADGSWSEVERALHSMRSTAGNLGLVGLQRLAGELEPLASDGSGDAIRGRLPELETVSAEALSAVRERRRPAP